MLRYLIFTLLTFYTYGSIANDYQDATEKEVHTADENISGLWQDTGAGNGIIGKSFLIIAQDGNEIHVTHYLEWKGIPMVEYGSGFRKGNIISYNVTVTKGIPHWATAGTHTMTISDNGTFLSGNYHDNHGQSGPIEFQRIGK